MKLLTKALLQTAVQEGNRYFVHHFTGFKKDARKMKVRPFASLEQAEAFMQHAENSNIIDYGDEYGRNDMHDMADGVDEFKIYLEDSTEKITA
ncbi:MAG: hypothetical protein KBB37_07195 [Bacteroidia bacterium]|nr:hypothetical protein [Bacteroidia bacterium]MBP7261055.1 hypothetical protein [Bacteroidia bacterium]MBP9178980.1 hypothetical protein [Bacteroidia bacterium]MBP9723281.1 hypothetical protein [Bacteroidia bacterium]